MQTVSINAAYSPALRRPALRSGLQQRRPARSVLVRGDNKRGAGGEIDDPQGKMGGGRDGKENPDEGFDSRGTQPPGVGGIDVSRQVVYDRVAHGGKGTSGRGDGQEPGPKSDQELYEALPRLGDWRDFTGPSQEESADRSAMDTGKQQ